jgi:dolichyl-diphosphooligosaccharide---protein glycosyltransferase
MGLVIVFFLCSTFVFHGTIIGAEVYSNPSVIIASKNQDGSRTLVDDFREAYKWLNENTKQDAKILSWWDYGY